MDPFTFYFKFTVATITRSLITASTSLLLLAFFYSINDTFSSSLNIVVVFAVPSIEYFLELLFLNITASFRYLLLETIDLFNILTFLFVTFILFVSFNGFVEFLVLHFLLLFFESLNFLLLL